MAGNERELTRASWLDNEPNNLELEALADSKDDDKFDQFKGRGPTTYKDELYSTNI